MNGGSASQDILNRIKVLVRRDLKLGADADIPDDMPFFGGDFDLDSLDVLLLLTSIEKEFGIKIPNEAVGQSVFQNVATLTRYIEDHSVGAMSHADPLSRLPHREPFRFVSKVTAWKEGQEAEGVWVVSGQEAFLAGHFPGQPVVPGVLIAEALAQVSGLVAPALGAGPWTAGKLAQVDVRFEQAVRPPAEIALRSRLVRAMGPLQLFEVSATVKGEVVAKGEVALKLETK